VSPRCSPSMPENKSLFTTVARGIARMLLLPMLLWFRMPLRDFSRFTAPSQLLSFIPGVTGVLLRRLWYEQTLVRCGEHLTVDWLAVFRTRLTEVGDNCTFGVGTWIGRARIGDDVLTGNHVTLLSGGRQHAFEDITQPMRLQHANIRQIEIGSDVWIGSHAVILNDVSSGTVIGAGSIVTKTFAANAVIVGNPARILRIRGALVSEK